MYTQTCLLVQQAEVEKYPPWLSGFLMVVGVIPTCCNSSQTLSKCGSLHLMNPSGSSLGQREQEPNMGSDSNCCSVSEPYHSRMGLISPLAPIPHCAGGWGWVGSGEGGLASVHTNGSGWLGLEPWVSCVPVQCSFLRMFTSRHLAHGSLMWPRVWEDPC